MHLAGGGGSRPRVGAGVRAPGQAGAEARWGGGRVPLPGAKPQTHESHPSPPGSPAAVAPAGSQARGSAAACEWLDHADCAGRTRAPSRHSFLPSTLGFDLPLAIVSKDQGTSVTFKGPIEPPGDEALPVEAHYYDRRSLGCAVFAWGTVWGSTCVICLSGWLGLFLF